MNHKKIAGIVLAAGDSIRMGYPKMILPWAKTTVIGQIIDILQNSKIDDILVVTGGWREKVESALSAYHVQMIYNSAYREGGMLSSVQVGISGLKPEIDAALIILGDQPFIKLSVVNSVLNTYLNTGSKLVVPSFEMQRGHPWLVDKTLWGEIIKLEKDHTLRDFLNLNQGLINYIPVNSNSILLDIDTPEDYQNAQPSNKLK